MIAHFILVSQAEYTLLALFRSHKALDNTWKETVECLLHKIAGKECRM